MTAAADTAFRRAVPLLAALFAASALLAAVYPGFMSYDSVQTLHEARNGVQGGNYPPFPSYVWRVFDAIWPGPALMLFAENFLLVFSFAAILRMLGHRSLVIVLGVAVFCLAPPLLGPMLVVWKDVAVSACFAAAVACFLAAERAKNPQFAIAVGIAMLFFGAAYRLNALVAVLPLLLWVAWQGRLSGGERGRSLIAGLLVFAGIGVAVTVVNGYRFPDLSPLTPNPLVQSMMIHDLVGMTAVSGQDLMPATAQTPPAADTVGYLRRIYDPRNVNLIVAHDSEARLKRYFAVPVPALRAAFLKTVAREPRAYLEHRNAVFRELTGLAGEPTVMATHPAVDDNDEGVTYRPGPMTARVLDYIRDESYALDGKPWLYYVLGTIAFAIAVLRGSDVHRIAVVAVYTSGALYLLSFFFLAPAADIRYNHWSIVCMFIVIAMSVAPLRQHTSPSARA